LEQFLQFDWLELDVHVLESHPARIDGFDG